MDGLTNGDIALDYHPIRTLDSDDSQSNASQSEENDALPGMTYTSDDSAEVIQSDSTYIDSDTPNFIAQNVHSKLDDDPTQQLLSERKSSIPSNPLGQINNQVLSHHTTNGNLHGSNSKDIGSGLKFQKKFSERPVIHLQVNPVESHLHLNRDQSFSSSSTEPEFCNEAPFLPQYEKLSQYEAEEEKESSNLNFDNLGEDPVKTQVITEQLSTMPNCKEQPKNMKGSYSGDRFYVGDVPIDSKYRDTFFVHWNWPKIRQGCVFVNLSFLIGFLCVGIGLVVQMPRGKECDPSREWWQGSSACYIDVKSFQDSNGDGYGDILGLISKLNYIQDLGFRSVRLAPVFETQSYNGEYQLESNASANYATVNPLLGDSRDLRLLAALLHERGMFLYLDLLIVNKGMPMASLKTQVADMMSLWLSYGVDGFFFIDAEYVEREYAEEVVQAMVKWRTVLNQYSHPLKRKVFGVSMEYLLELQSYSETLLQNVLSIVDMIDVRLDVGRSAEEVAEAISNAVKWDSHRSLPWVNWQISSSFEFRAENYSLDGSNRPDTRGLNFLPLFLPGSVALRFEGREFGALSDSLKKEENNQLSGNLNWPVPMIKEEFSKSVSAGDHRDQDLLLDDLKTLIIASENEAPLYINGIFEDVGSFHPSKSSNYKIRLPGDNLFLMERFFPRRNKFALVMNLGLQKVQKDLSKYFYGGMTLASSHRKHGYVLFRDILLSPLEVLVVFLDK